MTLCGRCIGGDRADAVKLRSRRARNGRSTRDLSAAPIRAIV
jgi:hypothetical protein